MAPTKTITINQTVADKVQIAWQIPHFLELRNSVELVNMQNCTFEMGEKIGIPTKWKINLTSQSDEQVRNRNTINIYASLIEFPEGVTDLHANVHFKVPSNGILMNKSYNDNMVKNGVGMSWGFENIISDKLIRCLQLSTSASGTLTIFVTVTIFKIVKDIPPLTSILQKYEQKFANTLRLNLSNLRDDPPEHVSNQPTKILSKDGKEFAVNRLILAARSPVFRRMFQAKMEEAETGIVNVNDINGDSLEVLLEFCHTGILKKDWQTAGVIWGLVYGAHKYMLDDLKEFLENVLHLICSPENCGKLMSLAKTFQMKEAEKQLFEYFKKNMVGSLEQVVSFVQDAQKGPDYNACGN